MKPFREAPFYGLGQQILKTVMASVHIKSSTHFQFCMSFTSDMPQKSEAYKHGQIFHQRTDDPCLQKKIFIDPFYGYGSIASRLQSHHKETVYVLIPIWSKYCWEVFNKNGVKVLLKLLNSSNCVLQWLILWR